VYGKPSIGRFKPCGIPITELEMVILTLDEFEALRLADMEGLYQEDAASRMKVSRQTFGNIIESAHRKVADVLINAKMLIIEGGNIQMTENEPCGCRRHENSNHFKKCKRGQI
jgi:predicted DNA-binding protein (UPF0251 family)